MAAGTAEAQGEFGPLFDTFNLRVEASWVSISSEIRLDSEILGEGTTVNFENLGLAADKTIPTLAFQWQISKRNRLGVRWQDLNRDSTAQVLEEIEWGGVTKDGIPALDEPERRFEVLVLEALLEQVLGDLGMVPALEHSALDLRLVKFPRALGAS